MATEWIYGDFIQSRKHIGNVNTTKGRKGEKIITQSMYMLN